MDKKYTYIKERVLSIADFKSISKEKFLADIGMTYGSFKGKAKEGTLNSDAVAKIYTKHPDINIEWLLTGKGEMIKNEESVHTAIPSLNENSKEHGKNYRDMYYDSLVKYQNLNEKYLKLKDAFESLKKDDKQLSVKP